MYMVYFLLVMLSFVSQCFSSSHLNLAKEPACIIAETPPDAFVNATVNVLDGAFYFPMHHIHASGHIPLDLIQYYNSQSNYSSWVGSGMSINYSFWIAGQVVADKDKDTYGKYSHVHMEAPGGSILIGLSKFDLNGMTYYLDPDIIHKGLTNTGSREISGRTNLKNLSIKTKCQGDGKWDWTVLLPDGTKKEYFRTFDHFQNSMNLKTERRPNRTQLDYGYYKYHEEEGTPRKISARGKKTWGKLYFEHDQNRHNAKITSSSGKTAEFFTFGKDGSEYIYEIKTTDNPKIHFNYTHAGSHYCIDTITWPEGRFLEVEYDSKARVVRQKAPVGPDGEKRTIWHFSYDDHETKAVDANDHKKIYRHKHKRLTAIEEYKKHKLFRSHNYIWGEKKGLSWGKLPITNEGNLRTEAVCSGDKKTEYARHLSYDDHGNVIKETVYGNLSGHGKKAFSLDSDGLPTDKSVENYHKYFRYSDKHLVVEAHEDDGPTYVFQYIPGTDLLCAKLTQDGKKIIRREFYSYDDDGILIEKTLDDGSTRNKSSLTGVSQRLVTTIDPVSHNHAGCGLPHIVAESYLDLTTKSIRFLKRTVYNYNKAGQVTEEAIFDAENKYRHSTYFEYDEKGRLIKKTDPFGRILIYRYDKNNNKIYEHLDRSHVSTNYTYDTANRLIKTLQHHQDGTYVGEECTYDLMGNKLTSSDRYGNTTRYEYDSLNRLKTTIFADNTTIKKKYDIFDNVIQETNQNGALTRYTYTAQKQLSSVTYADNSTERFEYNLNGTLKASWDAVHTKTSYAYDILGRITEIAVSDTTGNTISKTAYQYDAFHLVATTDPMGFTTFYKHDGAGRKIEEWGEDTGNYRKYTYEYDSLGRLSCTKRYFGSKVENFLANHLEYDALDRIILEKTVDATGACVRSNRYEYDICGNRTLVCSGYTEEDAEIRYAYNSQNELILARDECGNQTHYHIDHGFINLHGKKLPRKITTDANGGITEEYFDLHGQTISILKKNPHQEIIAHTDLEYSSTGKKTRQKEHVYIDGIYNHDYVITWEYDARDRNTRVVEQGDKVTCYAYDCMGRIQEITKPDLTLLTHTYDALGRLITLTSSDRSVSYSYRYDLHNNPIEVHDNVHNTITERFYDRWNYVLRDTNLDFSYDALGRLVQIALPDQSSVTYNYRYSRLDAIQRHSSERKLMYESRYTAFDLKDHVLEYELIAGLGAVHLSWDKKGRNTKISSDYVTEEIPQHGFDGVGNLKCYTLKDNMGHVSVTASYDDLYQLVEEKGILDRTYKYDSAHNRLAENGAEYNVDQYNKITTSHQCHYSYDKNGNLIQMQQGDSITRYAYDALDRLIQVNDTHYTYDSLNRRISRTHNNRREQFLYFGLQEIGSMVNDRLHEFRVLGIGKGAELGASVAIELDAEVYAPIADFRGNLVALISTETERIAESYRYTAFGECVQTTASKITNPWRFASKRFDTESGFVYFGKRYYTPQLGRWITPDPLGFADGPNMYAYVHNSPLTKFDLYGLYGLCQDDDFNLDAQLATGRFFGEFIRELAYAKFEEVMGIGRLVYSTTSFAMDFVANPSEVTQNVYASASEKWEAIQSTTWNDVSHSVENAVHSSLEHVVDNPASALAHAVANFTNPLGTLGNAGRGAKVLTVIEREQKVAQNGAKIVKDVQKSGQSKNKLKSNPVAAASPDRGKFRDMMPSNEAQRYESYWTKHAPNQSSPFSTYRRYTSSGDIKQVTTYDGFGCRHRQFDFIDTRRAPHQHNFTYGPDKPRASWGERSGHLPINE